MAEGGGEDPFAYKDPVLDDNLDNDDDDEQDTTRPFNLGASMPFNPWAASTPYNSEGQFEMQTTQDEQSGLPDTSYEETAFLRRSGSITDAEIERRLKALKEDNNWNY